jgi:hypothetical protein
MNLHSIIPMASNAKADGKKPEIELNPEYIGVVSL